MKEKTSILFMAAVIVFAVAGQSLATVLTWDVPEIANTQLFGWNYIGRDGTDGYGHKVDGGASPTTSVAGEYWLAGTSPPYQAATFNYREDGEGWTPNINAVPARPMSAVKYWDDGFTGLTDVLYTNGVRTIDIVFIPDAGYSTVLKDFKASTWNDKNDSLTYRVNEVTVDADGLETAEGAVLISDTAVVLNPAVAATISLGDLTSSVPIRLRIDVDAIDKGWTGIDDVRFSQIDLENIVFVDNGTSSSHTVQEIGWNTVSDHYTVCNGTVTGVIHENHAVNYSYQITDYNDQVISRFFTQEYLEPGDNSVILIWNPMTYPEKLGTSFRYIVEVSIEVDGSEIFSSNRSVILSGVEALRQKMNDYPRSNLDENLSLDKFRSGKVFSSNCGAVNYSGCRFDKCHVLNAIKVGADCIDLRFWWADFEKEPNVYDWELIDKGIEWAEELGIPVIISMVNGHSLPVWTREPNFVIETYGEPGWLKYGRKGLSYASTDSKQAFLNMVQAVVSRYQNKDIVVGWHFAPTMCDGAYSFLYDVASWQLNQNPEDLYLSDYSDHFKSAFQTYLQDNFTLGQINQRYGTAYSSFEEIELPLPQWQQDLDRRAIWWDFQNCKNQVYVDFITDVYQQIRNIDPNRMIYDWGLAAGAIDSVIDAKRDYNVVYNLSVFGENTPESAFQGYLAKRQGVPCISEPILSSGQTSITSSLFGSVIMQNLQCDASGHLAMIAREGEGIYDGEYEKWRHIYDTIRDFTAVPADVGVLASYSTAYSREKTFRTHYFPYGNTTYSTGKHLHAVMNYSGYPYEWFSDFSDINQLSYDLIIDNDSTILPENVISCLSSYVQQGGHLCIFADSGNYLPVETSGESDFALLDALGFPISQICKTSNTYSVSSAESSWQDIVGMQIHECLDTNGTLPSGFNTLATLSNGDPAVIEWQLGNGKVCLITGVYAWAGSYPQSFLCSVCGWAGVSGKVEIANGNSIRNVLHQKNNKRMLAIYSDYSTPQDITISIATPGLNRKIIELFDEEQVPISSATSEEIVFDFNVASQKAYIFYIYENLPGDITGDGKVDFYDLLEMSEQWFQLPGDPSADIAPEPPDGTVNFFDFRLLAQDWLENVF